MKIKKNSRNIKWLECWTGMEKDMSHYNSFFSSMSKILLQMRTTKDCLISSLVGSNGSRQ